MIPPKCLCVCIGHYHYDYKESDSAFELSSCVHGNLDERYLPPRVVTVMEH
jgi:hypothetical protein